MADLAKATVISEIDPALVNVPAGRRKADPVWVQALADLFAVDGQKTPIQVIAAGERFDLVFGLHRLLAAKLIGVSIKAEVKSPEDFASAAAITLAEITENFARRELSALDRAIDIARWREVYETAAGAVKRGRPSKLSQVATISDEGAELFAASFSEAARKALGINRDAISRAMRIASIGAEARDRIALHPIADNQSELLALAAEPTDRQAAIVALLTADPAQAASVSEAVAIIDRAPKQKVAAAWEQLSDKFSRLKPIDQERFFELHEAAFLQWQKGRQHA